MAIKRSITITNKSEDALFIDEDNTVSAKSKIKKDLRDIIDDLNAIEKHYKVLRDDKDTKGEWLETAKSCVSKSNKYETKMKNDRTSLEEAIDDAVQQYVLTQIKNMKAAKDSMDNLNVG